MVDVGVSWGYVVGLLARVGGFVSCTAGFECRVDVLGDKMDIYPMLDTRSVRKLGEQLVG